MNLGLYNNAEIFSLDTSPRSNNKNHESFMSYLKETSLPASPKNSSNFSVRNQARDFSHSFINAPTGFNEYLPNHVSFLDKLGTP